MVSDESSCIHNEHITLLSHQETSNTINKGKLRSNVFSQSSGKNLSNNEPSMPFNLLISKRPQATSSSSNKRQQRHRLTSGHRQQRHRHRLRQHLVAATTTPNRHSSFWSQSARNRYMKSHPPPPRRGREVVLDDQTRALSKNELSVVQSAHF